MLVLTRREGEQVVLTIPPSDVPTQIVVTMIETRQSRRDCRLGFEAAPRVRIMRRELLSTDDLLLEQDEG